MVVPNGKKRKFVRKNCRSGVARTYRIHHRFQTKLKLSPGPPGIESERCRASGHVQATLSAAKKMSGAACGSNLEFGIRNLECVSTNSKFQIPNSKLLVSGSRRFFLQERLA